MILKAHSLVRILIVIYRLNSRVWRVDIVDGHSALNASQCKACGLVLLVLEYGNTAVLQDQVRKAH